jgi:hypothetical protein
MERFWTKWTVLLISIIFLSSCGGSKSSTPTAQTPEGTVAVPTPIPLVNQNSATPNSGHHVGNTTTGSKSYYQAEVTSGIGITMNIEVDGEFSLSGATYSISVNKPATVLACSGPGCFDFNSFTDADTTVWYTTTGFVPSGTGAPWSIDCSIGPITGLCSIYSSSLPSSLSSCVAYTTTTSTNSYVSFDLKVSSSTQYYDLLLFYIDNVLQLPAWSAVVSQKVMFNTTTGTHTYKWCHTNNDTGTSGAVWVDNIFIQ